MLGLLMLYYTSEGGNYFSSPTGKVLYDYDVDGNAVGASEATVKEFLSQFKGTVASEKYRMGTIMAASPRPTIVGSWTDVEQFIVHHAGSTSRMTTVPFGYITTVKSLP